MGKDNRTLGETKKICGGIVQINIKLAIEREKFETDKTEAGYAKKRWTEHKKLRWTIKNNKKMGSLG